MKKSVILTVAIISLISLGSCGSMRRGSDCGLATKKEPSKKLTIANATTFNKTKLISKIVII